MKDLFALVADQDMVETLKALLNRPQSLGIRPIKSEVQRHLGRDPGCRTDAGRRLPLHLRRYHKAIVMLDKHGCGREDSSREDIQHEIERDLARNGCGDRAKAVVIDPELEAWIWTGSKHVAGVLGWQGEDYEGLKNWLMDRGLWSAGAAKPSDPKAAMQALLRKTRKAHSAALFGELARRTTLRHCQCPAFAELKQVLRAWFG